MKHFALLGILASISLACDETTDNSQDDPLVCSDGLRLENEACVDIDECAEDLDDCGANATCTNTNPSFSCECDAGYAGDGITCDDVDECAGGTANCDANATCQNTPGTFTCTCNAGYAGDGNTCADVDECADGTDTCVNPEVCLNTDGSFLCAAACDIQTDCGALSCGFAPNDGGSALQTVCLPDDGSNTGEPCVQGAECSSQACVNGFCSRPCITRADCVSGQLCVTETVALDGLSLELDVCKSYPDEVCTSSRDCSDGRVCGRIEGASGQADAYCEIPRFSAQALGTFCNDSPECFEQICLNEFNFQCSVACDDAALDCPAGFVCSETQLNDTPIPVCLQGCGGSSDCNGSQICTFNEDVGKNEIDTVCVQPIGNLNPGGVCSNDDDCRSGLCLSYVSVGIACTDGLDCAFGESCATVPNNASKRCISPISRCTEVCNDGTDCPWTPVTTCASRDFNLPGGGTQSIQVCEQTF